VQLEESGEEYLSNGECIDEDIREIGGTYLLSNGGEFTSPRAFQVFGSDPTQVDEIFAARIISYLVHDDGQISWATFYEVPITYSIFPTKMSELRGIFISESPRPAIVQVTQQGGAFVSMSKDGHALCGLVNEPCIETIDIGLAADVMVTKIDEGGAVLDSQGRFAVLGGVESNKGAVPHTLPGVKSFSEVGHGFLIVNSTGSFLHTMNEDNNNCILLSDYANGELIGIGYQSSSQNCVGLVGRDLMMVKDGEIETIPGDYAAFVGMSSSEGSWFVIAGNGTIFDSELQEVLGGRADTKIKEVLTGASDFSVFWFENGTVAVVHDSRMDPASGRFREVSCTDSSICSGIDENKLVQFWHHDKSLDFSFESERTVVQIVADSYLSTELYGLVTAQNAATLRTREEGDGPREEILTNVKQISIYRRRATALTTDGQLRVFDSSVSQFADDELTVFEALAPIQSVHQFLEGTLLLRENGEAHLIPPNVDPENLASPWKGVRRIHALSLTFLLEFEDDSGLTVGSAFKGGHRCLRQPTLSPTADPTQAPSPGPTASPTGPPTLSQAPTTEPTAAPTSMPSSSDALSRVAPAIASACFGALLLAA